MLMKTRLRSDFLRILTRWENGHVTQAAVVDAYDKALELAAEADRARRAAERRAVEAESEARYLRADRDAMARTKHG